MKAHLIYEKNVCERLNYIKYWKNILFLFKAHSVILITFERHFIYVKRIFEPIF